MRQYGVESMTHQLGGWWGSIYKLFAEQEEQGMGLGNFLFDFSMCA